MTGSDSARASILARRYERVDGNPQSGVLFRNLEPSSREYVLRDFQLEQGEIPVLFGQLAGDGRLILTTQRLLLAQQGKVSAFLPDEIQAVGVDLLENLNRGRTRKVDWRSLKLELSAGQTLELELGRDANIFGLESAISWLLTTARPALPLGLEPD